MAFEQLHTEVSFSYFTVLEEGETLKKGHEERERRFDFIPKRREAREPQ